MPQDRYSGINPYALDEHTTIEVRIHGGTCNPTKIVNWVKLLVAIVNAPKLERIPRTSLGLKRATGISNDLMLYVRSRMRRFADEHRGETKLNVA